MFGVPKPENTVPQTLLRNRPGLGVINQSKTKQGPPEDPEVWKSSRETPCKTSCDSLGQWSSMDFCPNDSFYDRQYPHYRQCHGCLGLLHL